MPQPLRLTETAGALQSAEPTGARALVQLIDPGWGSTGYYSPTVLAEAATRKVFKAGTHMYLDHPTLTEAEERPERSVRDLAAVLEEDASVGANGGLVAPVRALTEDGRTLLRDAGSFIGVSIRAAGMGTLGEAEGRSGLIVDSITHAESVDFVTKAGRGGQVLGLLESARRPVTVAEMAPGFTADDMRQALSTAVTDAYPNGVDDGDETPGEESWVYVEDFTDTWVVFRDGDDLYQQTYTVTGGTPELTGSPVEVTRKTTYVPEPPGAGGSTAPPGAAPVLSTESQEDTMPNLSEAEARELTEARTRAETQLAEAQTALAEATGRATAAEHQLAEAGARTQARGKATAALAESNLAKAYPAAVTRIVDAVSAAPKLTGDGKLDESAFSAALEAATKAEITYIEALTPGDSGIVRGLGESHRTDTTTDITAEMERQFLALGMTESAAKSAAGRS